MSMISACCMNTADGTKMPSICTSEMKCRSACPLDYVVWYRQTISLYLPHLFSFFLFMIHLILTIGWWTRIPYLSCLMLRGCLEMQHSEVADDYFSAHSFECGCWWFTSPFMLQMPPFDWVLLNTVCRVCDQLPMGFHLRHFPKCDPC